MTKIIKLPTVMALSALSRSTIYALAKKGEFPAPYKLTARSSGWDADEIENWIASRKNGGVK